MTGAGDWIFVRARGNLILFVVYLSGEWRENIISFGASNVIQSFIHSIGTLFAVYIKTRVYV